jgi:hypothetical protein
MNDTLDAIKALLAKDVEVRDEVADLIDRRAREIADSAGESDPQPVPTPTVAAPKSPATARAAKPAKPRSR